MNKFNSLINKSEAEALKEMIFRRAQERSESINANVQNDVMDLARDSFVSNNNPFARIIEQTNESANAVQPAMSAENANDNEEIGFPIKESAQIIFSQSRLIEEQLSNAFVATTMQEARAGLSNKQSFMGALNFLNSQAAISLVKQRADRFEIIA